MSKSHTRPFLSLFFQLRSLIPAMGPGILMAAAAVGASHLVASTRAGAEFGWQLAWVILAVNLLKYPFLPRAHATRPPLVRVYLKAI